MFRDAAGEPVLFSWVQHLSDYVHAIPRDAVVVDALAAAAPAPPPAPAPAPALVPSSVPVPAPVAADAGASAAAAAAGVEVFSGEPLSDRKSTFQVQEWLLRGPGNVGVRDSVGAVAADGSVWGNLWTRRTRAVCTAQQTWKWA